MNILQKYCKFCAPTVCSAWGSSPSSDSQKAGGRKALLLYFKDETTGSQRRCMVPLQMNRNSVASWKWHVYLPAPVLSPQTLALSLPCCKEQLLRNPSELRQPPSQHYRPRFTDFSSHSMRDYAEKEQLWATDATVWREISQMCTVLFSFPSDLHYRKHHVPDSHWHKNKMLNYETDVKKQAQS